MKADCRGFQRHVGWHHQCDAVAVMKPSDLTQRTYEFGVAVELVDEAEQLRRIFTASQLTAKRRER